MKIGDLVKYHFTGKVGIIVKSKQPRLYESKSLTLFYVEWLNDDHNGWISAMNLRRV
jgi:hypothetical protein